MTLSGSVQQQFLHLVRVAIPADGLSVEAFLRGGEGAPRGFWGREDGWVAHWGAVSSLGVEEGGDRFAAVRRAADRIRGEPDLTGEVGVEGAIRFYGGFSFLPDHEPRGVWEGFPAACFILPEMELERRGGRTVLSVQGAVRSDEGIEALRRRLRARGAALLHRGLRSNGRMRGQARIAAREVVESRRGAWEGAVATLLEAIVAREVDKVVLARTMDVTLDAPLDPLGALDRLRRENPQAHVFLFEPTPGAVFMGAAPETVATLQGGVFRATAVAGSIPPGATGPEGEALARKLLASAKDRSEHEVTVREMVEALAPVARGGVEADPEPHILRLSRIQHLETRIRAEIPQDAHILSLLERLHPTPAVCGFPREAALALIHREEPFERGWYAGPVGWFDSRGEGGFIPALRSAVGHGSRWRLFAGAGIVAGSDPALEWEETAIKFEPALQALLGRGRP